MREKNFSTERKESSPNTVGGNAATYKIVIYCPDTNVFYDGDTPDLKGIGGGKTAIIRQAAALSRAGHKVTCYVNCDRPGMYSGVEYRHFSEARHISCDVFIATTSGGELDLSPLSAIPASAGLRAVWLHGGPKPKGLEGLSYDFLYVASHFMKEMAIREWNVPADKILVMNYGVEEANFREAGVTPRDRYSVVYLSHPSKGLDVAAQVVRKLREKDKRFHLDIYGGYGLYGGPEKKPISEEEGIFYKGLFGQKEMAGRLFSYGFFLALQEYREPFGLAVVEAKRAGVIVIASKLGAHEETIRDGFDGLLIEEDYRSAECREKTIRLVEYITANKEYESYLRENAMRRSFSWDRAAESYTAHWKRVLNGERKGRKFVISGWYGAENTGDEAVLSSALKIIKNSDPDAEVTVVSANPFHTEKAHGCQAVARHDFPGMARAVKESDFVIVGGGGLFQDYQKIETPMLFEAPSSGVTSYAVVPIMAKIYGKPLFYYAQGFGPLFSEEAMDFTRFACGLADIITVRDEPSGNLLKFIGVDESKMHLTADPVVNMKLPPDERVNYMYLCEDIPRDKKLISVVARFWLEKRKEEDIIKSLAGTIKEFSGTNPDYFFVLIPFSPTDLDVYGRIGSLAGKSGNFRILKKKYAPDELAAFISKSEVLIGMRFHSCIFAALGHVPFIALNYDYKVETFAKEMGLEEFILELIDIDSERLSEKLNTLLSRREALSRGIAGRIKEMSERELLNGDLLEDFMKKTTSRNTPDSAPYLNDYIRVLQRRLQSLDHELEYREIEKKKLANSLKDLQTGRNTLAGQLTQAVAERKVLMTEIAPSKLEMDHLQSRLGQVISERDHLRDHLNFIQSGDFWKLATSYWKIRNKLFEHPHKFLRIWRREGLKRALKELLG